MINWKALLRGATATMFLISGNIVLLTYALNGELWAAGTLVAIDLAILAWMGIEVKQK